VKRFEVKYGGLSAGYVYADTADAARRSAQAGYRRIHPDRDPSGQVSVNSAGSVVESEPAEAQKIVSEVYEGLRLLPGMETPAEKLRSALILLEGAVARDQFAPASKTGRLSRTDGGDSEFQVALTAVLESQAIPSPIQARLAGLIEWVGLNTPDDERTKIEGQAFQTLWENDLVDVRYPESPNCKLYEASTYLTARLVLAGALRVERFAGASTLIDFRTALAPYGKDAATLPWTFVSPDREGAIEVRQPLVFVGDRMLQAAVLSRGVPSENEDVVAFDLALYDTLDRLQTWAAGLGKLAQPYFKDKHRQFLERAETRITTTRKKMAAAAQAGGTVLPPDTARRDLLKFLIDQVHRIHDALSLRCPDRSLSSAFAELVFKDVVFRGAGAYLSKRFGINIDTAVVEGADSEGLVGRYKNEQNGPKPKTKTSRIHSVVVPCYTQDGVSIRPASLRLGLY
jgi:hypothetical protein